MYYHLEKLVNDLWVSAGFVLKGDFRTHTVLLDVLRRKYAMDFRAKRITDTAAFTLQKRGFTVMSAPEDIDNDRFSNP